MDADVYEMEQNRDGVWTVKGKVAASDSDVAKIGRHLAGATRHAAIAVALIGTVAVKGVIGLSALAVRRGNSRKVKRGN